MFGLMLDPANPARVRRVAVATCADGAVWAAWPGGVASAEGADASAVRAAPQAKAGPAPEGQVRAPCAGTLSRIDVAIGDVVSAGTPVATLEAMKMEFALVAPAAGTVQKVPVAVGTVVQKGAVVAWLTLA